MGMKPGRLLILLLMMLPGLLRAQEIRTRDGRKYMVHTVEAGQTLYAIARVYAVPVEAITVANPGSQEVLRVGQELLVPTDAVVRKEARSAPALLKDGELRHTAARKETLYGIAKRYQVDVNDLMARNPALVSGGLREGMEVFIPVAKVTGVSATSLRPADGTPLVDYVVQPGETLYSMGQRWGLSPEAIQALNGGLTEGLKAGMTIRLPGGLGAGVKAAVPVPNESRAARYHIGLLLPFSVARNDSVLQAEAATNPSPRYYEATRIAAQFYAGALMALDSATTQGLNAEVTVLDMGDDQRRWNAALKNPAIPNIDLFIGPFHRSAIEQLVRVNGHAHIVCPVPQTNKVILGNPTVSKVAPARSDLVKFGARYVALRHARDHIVFLRPDLAADKEMQEQLLTTLNTALVAQPGYTGDSVQCAKPGRRDLGDLVGKLSTTQLNILVSSSEDVEFVTTLVSKLKPLASKYRIELVGMESWLTMDPVAASDLDLLGFTCASATFADPMDPRLVRFTRMFRDRFKTDVDAYALLGFDVTYFYLLALMTEGVDFAEHFDRVRTEPLNMGFNMGRTGPENGFRNEYGIMLQQKDLQLVKAP